MNLVQLSDGHRFVEIRKQTALDLFRMGSVEIFEVHNDSEMLLESENEILDAGTDSFICVEYDKYHGVPELMETLTLKIGEVTEALRSVKERRESDRNSDALNVELATVSTHKIDLKTIYELVQKI